jgi:hypothetical protein
MRRVTDQAVLHFLFIRVLVMVHPRNPDFHTETVVSEGKAAK